MKTSRTLASIVLLAALAVPGVAARQEWRAQAIASFDEIWQTIHDTYYDPTFGGLDWDAVRTELRPKVQGADSPESARAAMRDMLARLHHSHFVLLSSDSASEALPGEAMVPIEVRVAPPGLVITKVTPGSAAEQAGLHPGDVIVGIDGQTTQAWTAELAGRDERARNLEMWRKAYRALHGEAGSKAALKVRASSGDERTINVTRSAEAGQIVKLGNLPQLHLTIDTREMTTESGRRVGYIGFNFWMPAIDAPISEAVDKYRTDAGFIIDLRGNPGGLAGMMSGVAGQFMSEPTLLGNMQMRDAAPHFSANPRNSTPDGRRVTPFAGPLAIIVDELSASTSECFAGALQSVRRARIFGRPSMGQALPASTKTLANGDVLMYAVGDFVTATGHRLEGEGVTPDEAQPLSIEALEAGRDLPIEAALGWIGSNKQAGK